MPLQAATQLQLSNLLHALQQPYMVGESLARGTARYNTRPDFKNEA